MNMWKLWIATLRIHFKIKWKQKRKTPSSKRITWNSCFMHLPSDNLNIWLKIKKVYRRYLNEMDFGARRKSSVKNSANWGLEGLTKGLIRLALMDLDKLDKPANAKSYIADTIPKCAEYLFQKKGCSLFLIRCCLKKSWGPATAKLMTSLTCHISGARWGTGSYSTSFESYH